MARRLVAGVVVTLGVLATGCTSSGAPVHRSSAAPAPSTSAASGLPSGAAVPAATVGALVTRGIASLRSAHLTLAITVASSTVTTEGDETVRAGRLQSIRLASTLPSGGSVEIRIVGGRTYAKLPASLLRTTRPWVLIASTSPSAKIRSLATSVDASVSAASVSNAGAFVSAAQSVRRIGAATIGGIPTTRYGLIVDVARLPTTFPGRKSLSTVGLANVPVQLWLDGGGRPVRVSESVEVLGHTTTAVATLSRINEPVAITAPPAGQVGTQ